MDVNRLIYYIHINTKPQNKIRVATTCNPNLNPHYNTITGYIFLLLKCNGASLELGHISSTRRVSKQKDYSAFAQNAAKSSAVHA